MLKSVEYNNIITRMHNPVVDLHFLIAILFFFTARVSSATFTFINTCDFTVWPGILSNAGNPELETTGFELKNFTQLSIGAPAGWSGRFWGRAGCKNEGSESKGMYCSTGDCGSKTLGCNGNGPMVPVTLAEFSLGSGGLDFYDVSLVDGYNLPMIVETSGGSGNCGSAGCLVDINHKYPPELRLTGGGGCKSACIAFASPEYCCSGEYSTPANCRPSMYSAMFKLACPTSYSYAYDDSSSTFTCAGADYSITFCPSTPRKTRVEEEGSGKDMGGGGGVNGSEKSVVVGWSETGEMSEKSWMAGLAMGGVAGQFGVLGLLGWGLLFLIFFCFVW